MFFTHNPFPLLICRRKLSSATRPFVITLTQASRVFFGNSSVSAGSLKIRTPLCLRLVAQPYMKLCAPGIAKKSPKYDDFKFPQLDLYL